MKHAKRLLLLSTMMLSMVLVTACFPVRNDAAREAYDERDATTRELRDAGIALRNEIDRTYWTARGTRQELDVQLTQVVSPYLVGATFDRAERILHYAGMQRSPRRTDHYPAQFFQIQTYVHTFPDLQLGIVLYPTGKFQFVKDLDTVDWSRVQGVSAGFFRIWP